MVSYLTLLPLREEVFTGTHPQSYYTLLWLRYLQFSLMLDKYLVGFFIFAEISLSFTDWRNPTILVYIDADTRLKGIQKGDHKIIIVDFSDDTTIFLIHINYLTKKGLTLKLIKKPSNSKINLIQKGFMGWGI